MTSTTYKTKILLLNSPWINTPNESCVKSGTRWAAVRKKDSSLPYFPFPYIFSCTASYLQKQGFDCQFKDGVAEEISFETCLNDVNRIKPNLLVIEAFTPSIDFDLDFMKRAKKQTNCYTLFCGVHPSGLPKEMLSHDFLDFVALGEYEGVIKQVAESIENENFESLGNIKGLAYKKNNEIIVHKERQYIENLDDIPYPELSDESVKRYNEPFSRYFPNSRLVTTRGCPYSCIYCIEPITNGRWNRKRSLDHVANEILNLKKKYGVKEVTFDDTIFPVPRAKEIANEFIKREIDIYWSGWMDWNIGFEDLELLRKSGCVGLKFGIESADPKILKSVGKPAYLKKLSDLVKNCKKLGIRAHGSIQVGLPGDTKETMEETIQLPFKIGLHSCQISIATPFPGTPFFDQAKQNKWIKEPIDWSLFDPLEGGAVEYPNCSQEDIRNAFNKFKKLKVRHFLKSPSAVCAHIIKLIRFRGPLVFTKELILKINFVLKSLMPVRSS